MEMRNFSDFCSELQKCGFSMGGGKSKGIFSLVGYSWEEQDNIDSPIKWHTGDSETDPWEWRMRALEERDDIAYAKLFFKSSGFITKEWYPYFYAVRRNGADFEEAYSEGKMSSYAKRIYSYISEAGKAASHEIKATFSKEEKSKFDKAIIDLQQGMYITICGRTQKMNKYGEGYGWNTTVFTTVEDFWKERGMEIASAAEKISPDSAQEAIRNKILTLNPEAEERKIKAFING